MPRGRRDHCGPHRLLPRPMPVFGSAALLPRSCANCYPIWHRSTHSPMECAQPSTGIVMPFADDMTIILGADGFVGRHLVDRWRANGWPVHPIGRQAGDFTDAAAVDAAVGGAPRSGRIIHTVTKQRTGAVQYDI